MPKRMSLLLKTCFRTLRLIINLNVYMILIDDFNFIFVFINTKNKSATMFLLLKHLTIFATFLNYEVLIEDLSAKEKKLLNIINVENFSNLYNIHQHDYLLLIYTGSEVVCLEKNRKMLPSNFNHQIVLCSILFCRQFLNFLDLTLRLEDLFAGY